MNAFSFDQQKEVPVSVRQQQRSTGSSNLSWLKLWGVIFSATFVAVVLGGIVLGVLLRWYIAYSMAEMFNKLETTPKVIKK